MLRLNENKTIKELSDKGFSFGCMELLYPVKEGIYLSFCLNELDYEYLKYNGDKCLMMITQNEYETERLEALKELKESGFVVEC